MPYVHHCHFCGWHRPAEQEAVLEPHCPECGCVLRAHTAPAFERLVREERRRDRIPPASGEVTGVFALLAAGPLLLPALGVHLGDIEFLVPLVLLLFGALGCVEAARRPGRLRRVWSMLAVAAGLGAAASALAVVAALLRIATMLGFYVGAGASAVLLAALALLAARTLPEARIERLVDGLLITVLLAAVGVYFVAIPGFRDGDAVLTAVFLVDLLAVVLAGIAAASRPGSTHRKVGWWLAAGSAAAMLGDALVSEAAAGRISSFTGGTAVCWAIGGYALAVAADIYSRATGDDTQAERPVDIRWVFIRVLLPMGAVITLPGVAVALWATGHGALWSLAYFGSFSAVLLLLVFGRQAYLLVDNHRAVVRERRMRTEALERNKELEALTGLATTMTQTLEEAPITEQALSVLHLAAHATSSALHVRAREKLVLAATLGSWQDEHSWAGTPSDEPAVATERRGNRQIARLALFARGQAIGAVTFIRPEDRAFGEQELELLKLLVDQMAVAIQNARDYRDKLEQAIRDPLTGVYNRRFFFEALSKEIHRHNRYGSPVSVVILDVNDFKSINDGFGHAAGDDALREIGQTAAGLIRPVDSLARIGGEEFALLLPETEQLDALVVAERLRTAIGRQRIVEGRRVTISAGVASCPQDARTLEELQQKADVALYWAKQNGKDTCAVAREAKPLPGEGRTALSGHLSALVATIDAQQLHTREHSQNVATYAAAIAQRLRLEDDQIIRVRRAALLHDVGKVAVDGAILNKPGRLTDAEYEEVKLHSTVGATIVEHAGLHEEAAWVRHHHERIDGAGYPDGRSGDAIPLEARIIFVADSFEAMTSDRPYRPGMAIDQAIAELRRNAGSQFDPEAVAALVELITADQLPVAALRRAPASEQAPAATTGA